MVKIILVRHGETDWNRIKRIQGGDSDIPLNENGLRQAQALAVRLKDEKITVIYSSPLQRALNTAQAIAAYHHLEVKTLPALKEIKVGELEGHLASELLVRFDEYLCGDGNGKNPHQPPGGETAEDVQKRSWKTIVNMADQHPDSTLVIVSHYFVILTVICRVLNMPVSQIIHLRMSTGTISSFVIDDGNLRLELFNDGCHNLKQ